MRNGTSETVKSPHDDCIKSPFVGILHHSVQLWSGIFLAGHAVVDVDVMNLPSFSLAVFFELACLHRGVLAAVQGGDPRIDGCTDCRGFKACLSYYAWSHFDLLLGRIG